MLWFLSVASQCQWVSLDSLYCTFVFITLICHTLYYPEVLNCDVWFINELINVKRILLLSGFHYLFFIPTLSNELAEYIQQIPTVSVFTEHLPSWKSTERRVWIRIAESSLLRWGRAEFSLVSQRWHTVPIQCSQRRPRGKLPYLVLWFCKWRTSSGLVRVWDLTVWRGNYPHGRPRWHHFLFH